MKKLISVLLALMMAILPMAAMAASPGELLSAAQTDGRVRSVTISMTPGTLPLADEIVTPLNDLIAAIGLNAVYGDDTFSASLLLSDKNVADFALQSADNRFTVQSNLLGEEPIAFTEEEFRSTLKRLVALYGKSAQLTEAQIDEVNAQIDAMFAGSAANAMTGLDISDVDFTPFENFVMTLAAKAESSEVTQQPRSCDAAATVITMTLTAEDITGVYSTLFDCIKASDKVMAQLEGITFTVDERLMSATEAMDYVVEKIRAGVSMFEDVPMSIYLDADSTPVGFTMVMQQKKPADTADSDDLLSVTAEYLRQTTTDGVGHTLNVEIREDEDDGVGIMFNLLTGSEKTVVANAYMAPLEADEDGDIQAFSIDFSLDKDYADTTAQSTATLTFAAHMKDGTQQGARFVVDTTATLDGTEAAKDAVVKAYMLGQDAELLTMNIRTEIVDALAAIDTENALRPGQMTDEELNAWVGTIAQTAMTKGVVLLQSLPASVLQLAMNTASAQ